MNTILIILCIAGLIYFYYQRKKIDKDEAEALKKPGTADMLRNNFGNIVDYVLAQPNRKILFEREYDQSIRIGIDNSTIQTELFMSYSMGFKGPELHIAIIKSNSLLHECTFKKGDSPEKIYTAINHYFS